MQKLPHNHPRSQILSSCDAPPLTQGDESRGSRAPIVFSWTHCHCQHRVLMSRNTPTGKLGSAEYIRNDAGLLSFLPWENPSYQHRCVSSTSCPDTAALSPAKWETGLTSHEALLPGEGYETQLSRLTVGHELLFRNLED